MIFFQSRDWKEDLSCKCKCSIIKSKGDFKHSLLYSLNLFTFGENLQMVLRLHDTFCLRFWTISTSPRSQWNTNYQTTQWSRFYFLEGIQEQIQLLRRRANAQYVSFRNYRQYTIYIITSDYKTHLSCNTPHRRNTTVSLEICSFYTKTNSWK